VGRFRVRDADKRREGHALLQFRCWIGGGATPADAEFDLSGDEEPEWWVRDVEEYVRLLAVKYAQHVLLFESEPGELAAVSAFTRQDVPLPAGEGEHRDRGDDGVP
jgi:hypothetical protein